VKKSRNKWLYNFKVLILKNYPDGRGKMLSYKIIKFPDFLSIFNDYVSIFIAVLMEQPLLTFLFKRMRSLKQSQYLLKINGSSIS